MSNLRVGTGSVDIISTVAQVVHETVRGYRNAMHEVFPHQDDPGYEPIPSWAEATEEQINAAMGLAVYSVKHPDTTPEQFVRHFGDMADVMHIALMATRQVFGAMGLSVHPMPESDRTGAGGVQ